MTVTLESIKTEQERLAKMISDFERQSSTFPITVAFPDLNDGELAVGVIISADGLKKEWLILLPGDSDGKAWAAQMEWAKSIGGELPDKLEASLLHSVMKEEFKPEAYWTSEKYVDSYAWCQGFDDGIQDYSYPNYELRARAVRRSPI